MKNLKHINYLFLLILTMNCASCGFLSPFSRNYTNPQKPRYAETKTNPSLIESKTDFLLVSYNIKKSKKIEKAIKVLIDGEVADADITCLQEMDLPGTKRIADELHMNYVYYPATSKKDKDFGNAVLSRWPIVEDVKVILPHLSKPGFRQRIAVGAKINIEGEEVMVYSSHLSVNILPSQRGDQIDKILQSIPEGMKHVIVAGDFNSFTKAHIRATVEPFKEENFTLITKNIEWTYKHWYFLNSKSTPDHIFTRNITLIDSGTINNRHGSDHVPLWIKFSFPKDH